jgi:hypothetical protein
MVDYYWSDIERVAAALEQRRRLSGEEARDRNLGGVTINGVTLSGLVPKRWAQPGLNSRFVARGALTN